jgi:hypothetical protein
VDAGKLTPFRWWFKSGKFPAGWALRQFEATLQLHGTVDAPATMAERLAELSEAVPLPAVRCLSLLLPATRDAWKPGEWPQQVRVILGRALYSDNLPLRWSSAWAHREKTTGTCWNKPYLLRLPKV